MTEKIEIKQVIILRSDLKMSKGKLVAQGAHASLISYFKTEKYNPDIAAEWLKTGEKKIILKLNDEESLVKLFIAFEFKKIPCALITDAGLTEVPPGTKTALGIGPWKNNEIDFITDRLKLL